MDWSPEAMQRRSDSQHQRRERERQERSEALQYDPFAKQCVWCGSYAARLFCSNTCRRKYEKEERGDAQELAVCGICGDEFVKLHHSRVYCSMGCSRMALWKRKPLLCRKWVESHPEDKAILMEIGLYIPKVKKIKVIILEKRKPTKKRATIDYDEPISDRKLEQWNDLKFKILYEAKD